MYHFNHAGASPSPLGVVERVKRHIELEQEIGGYAAAEVVTEELNSIYQSIATLIHADGPNEIALVESATVGWTRAFYAMAEKQLRDNPTRNVILISEAEYAANVVAACQWARSHDWTVLAIPSRNGTMQKDNHDVVTTTTGKVDVDVLQQMLEGDYDYTDPLDESKTRLDPHRIALVCITHVPTNSGIVNPVEKIGSLVVDCNLRHQDGGQGPILYLVDSCQSIGQIDINVGEIHCHALVATGRKYLRAPRGTGFLFVTSSLLESLIPSHVDHFGCPVRNVPTSYQSGFAIQNLLDFAPRSDARRFEFWESSAAGRLGLGVAVKHALETSLIKIQANCFALSRRLRSKLASLPSIYVHHENDSTCGIVTFVSSTVDSQSIKEKLKQALFDVTIVPATSTPIDSAKTGVPNLVRASISYTNTEEEIDIFINQLASILESQDEVSTESH